MRPVLNSIGSTISELGRSIRNTFSTAVKAIGKLADRVTAIVRPTREIHSQHKGSEQRKIGAFRDATIEIPAGTRRSSTVRETAYSTDAHDEGDLTFTPFNIASSESRLTEAEDTRATDAHDEGDLASTPSNIASTDSRLTEAEDTRATDAHDEGDFASTPSSIASTDSRLTEAEDTRATDAHDEGDFAFTPSSIASTDSRLIEAEDIHATGAHDEGDLASTPSNIASADSRLAEAENTHAPASQDKQKFTPTPFNNVFLRKQILEHVGVASPASCANLITELAKKHQVASEFKEALMASLNKAPKLSLGVNLRHLNDAQQGMVLEIFASLPIDKVDSIEMRNAAWHDCESPDTITINQKNTPLTRFLESENAIEKLSSFEMAGVYRSRGDHLHREANYDGALFDRLKGLRNLKLDLSYENPAYSGMRTKTRTVLEELHLKIEYKYSGNERFGIHGNIRSFPKTRRLIMNISPKHFNSVPRIIEGETTLEELILKQSDLDAAHRSFSEMFENYGINVEIQKTSESSLNITFLDSERNVSVKFQDFQ